MNPYTILLSNVLPIFAEDAHEMVIRLFEQAKSSGEEIDVVDGFDLYKQLASIRRLFAEALPEYEAQPLFVPRVTNACQCRFSLPRGKAL